VYQISGCVELAATPECTTLRGGKDVVASEGVPDCARVGVLSPATLAPQKEGNWVDGRPRACIGTPLRMRRGFVWRGGCAQV
jgi:hypothetical protein